MKHLLLSIAMLCSYLLQGQGTVTSVNFNAVPSAIFNPGGGPITTSGTLTLSLDNQTQKTFLAGPIDGSSPTTPAFRPINDFIN